MVRRCVECCVECCKARRDAAIYTGAVAVGIGGMGACLFGLGKLV